MSGGEMQTVREYLGLTGDLLADILEVAPRTIRDWESGRKPIPYRIPGAMEQLQTATASTVAEVTAALHDQRDPTVLVYRTDEDFHAERPDVVHLNARWWRHVVARAVQEVPGAVIASHAPLETRSDRASKDQ